MRSQSAGAANLGLNAATPSAFVGGSRLCPQDQSQRVQRVTRDSHSIAVVNSRVLRLGFATAVLHVNRLFLGRGEIERSRWTFDGSPRFVDRHPRASEPRRR